MVPNVDRVNRGHQKAVMDPEKDGNAVLSVSLDWLLRGVVVSQPSKKAKTLQVATNGQRSPIILGTVRVDDPGVIQCAIQVAIHETGSRPQNRGKGGSRIV